MIQALELPSTDFMKNYAKLDAPLLKGRVFGANVALGQMFWRQISAETIGYWKKLDNWWLFENVVMFKKGFGKRRRDTRQHGVRTNDTLKSQTQPFGCWTLWLDF